MEAVAASLREFGFRQPIVVDDDGVIIVGHTRWKAAKKLGLAKVPVHVAKDLTPEQVKAYRIADNQTATAGGVELRPAAHRAEGPPGGGLQPGPAGLRRTTNWPSCSTAACKEGLTDPDDVPAPPDEAITQPGDLWVLGNHRLLCGDSSKAEDVDRLLDGATDPPGQHRPAVQRQGRLRGATTPSPSPATVPSASRAWTWPSGARRTPPTEKLRPKDRPLVNDFISDEEFARLLRAWFGNIARVLEPGRGFYIWGGYAQHLELPNALKECELYFSQMIIWVKEHPVLTRKDFMGNHEWCFYGWKEGAAHKFFGPANITDVWSVKKVNPQSMVHLTEKPVELAVRAMQYSSASRARTSWTSSAARAAR